MRNFITQFFAFSAFLDDAVNGSHVARVEQKVGESFNTG